MAERLSPETAAIAETWTERLGQATGALFDKFPGVENGRIAAVA